MGYRLTADFICHSVCFALPQLSNNVTGRMNQSEDIVKQINPDPKQLTASLE